MPPCAPTAGPPRSLFLSAWPAQGWLSTDWLQSMHTDTQHTVHTHTHSQLDPSWGLTAFVSMVLLSLCFERLSVLLSWGRPEPLLSLRLRGLTSSTSNLWGSKINLSFVQDSKTFQHRVKVSACPLFSLPHRAHHSLPFLNADILLSNTDTVIAFFSSLVCFPEI